MLYQMDPLGKIAQKSLDRVVWETDMKPEQLLSNTTLLNGDMASYHLVQIRGKETLHKHDYHDMAVFVNSGTGNMYMGKESVKVSAGSFIFVQHGVKHKFVNTGPNPAQAIVIFSPPYDGKDYVEEPADKN